MSYDESEFQELLNAACDDKLTLEQSARLEEIIASDPAALRRYDQYMQLDLEMHFLARSLPEPRPPVSVRQQPAVLVAPPARGSESLLTLAYWRAHPARFASLALVLTLVMWAGFYKFVLEDLWPPASSPPVSNQYIARISGDREVVWADGALAHKVDAQLERGVELEISDGYLEVTFERGAVVILEGPAKLVVSRPNSGDLEYGRLVARVESAEARGFSVSTPNSQLIDYGTRFGVESSDMRGTVVEVFEGIVDATPLTSGADGRVTSLRLAAGQAASLPIGGSEFVRRESYANQFVETLPTEDAELPKRLIFPESASTSVTDQYVYSPEQLIDGSGLSRGTNNSLVHWGLAPDVCCQPGDVNCWMTPLRADTPVLLTFDLGHKYELTSIHLWNYTHAQVGGFFGAREIKLSFSDDGQHFEPAGVVWAPAAKELPAQESILKISGEARFVRFELVNNHVPMGAADQDPHVGLGEVQFEGRPVTKVAPPVEGHLPE